MSTPRVPTYRLHKATGLAVVRLDGRDFYLGKHGSPESRVAYDRRLAEWLANRAAAPLQRAQAEDLTVAELLDAYLRHAESYYVKNGKVTSEVRGIEDSIKPLFALYGSTPANAFSPLGLKAVRQRMIEGNLSRRLINHRINRIRRVFKWAVGNEIVSPSVLDGLRAVEPLKRGRCGVREAPPVLPVPEDQIEAVLAIAPRQIAAMIRLQWLTGMRPGEVVMMRRRDLDTSGSNWTYTPAAHKTEHHGRQRVICLGPKARQVLEPFLALGLDQPLFSPKEVMAEKGADRRRLRRSPMTPSQRARGPKADARSRPGEFYTTESYGRAISRLCQIAMPWPALQGRDRSELSPAERSAEREWRRAHTWAPNRLRHTAGTNLRKVADLDTARTVLGHSSVGVTEIYAERDLAKAAEVMERYG